MPIKLDSGFEITQFSDLSVEEMTVELLWKGEQICRLTVEHGIHEIEFFVSFLDDNFQPIFNLSHFLEGVEIGRRMLTEFISEKYKL